MNTKWNTPTCLYHLIFIYTIFQFGSRAHADENLITTSSQAAPLSETNNNHDVNNNNNNNSDDDDFRVRYIFGLGSEGTGHHSAENTLANSPIQKKFYDVGVLHELQIGFCMIFWRFLLNGCHILKPEGPNDNIFNELKKQLLMIDEKIRENKDIFDGEGMGDKGVMNVHLNLDDGCTVSYPSYERKECRDQQYLSLHVFYKACREANVDCGHVVMIRDGFDVWSSTAAREFDGPIRLAHTLAMKLDSIASQMLSYGHHLVGCLDYDDPEKELATVFTQNLLGWNNVPNGELDEALKTYYTSAQHHHDAVEMIRNHPGESKLFIESMVVTTNLIKKLCVKQLNNRVQNSESREEN